MKFEILKWAYEAELPPEIKSGPHSVLIALAYSAHLKTEACFPSIARISRLTRLKETAVKSGIKLLKKYGLITVKSGKGKKKSNHYTINYWRIDKKGKLGVNGVDVNGVDGVNPSLTSIQASIRQTDSRQTGESSQINADLGDKVGNSESVGMEAFRRLTGQSDQTQTENDHENGLESAESDYVIGRNTATNKESKEKEKKSVCSSSTNMSKLSDEEEHTHTPEIFVDVKGERRKLFIGDAKHKPVGMVKARKLASEWMAMNGDKWFRCKLSDKQIKDMVDILTDALALYTEPPKISFDDIETLLRMVKNQDDWNILEDTIEKVIMNAEADEIKNGRAYFLKAIRDNIENRTADRDTSDDY